MHFGREFVIQAIGLARDGLGRCSPNPSVGCVLTNSAGVVLGEGQTQEVGGPHAEVMAIRNAVGKGYALEGATAYVTLEPCSHYGRTGPCSDALIHAGIRRVVTTNTDPNPLVSGEGISRLRAAGIEVEVLPPQDPLAIESRELNIGFFSRMIRKRPWVRAKIAASLDGKTALLDGSSKWITSLQARTDGHLWRARACAVLTGVGTVLRDNPRLDVHLVETMRQPILVIVDSDLRIPPDAAVFSAKRKVFIYTVTSDANKANALRARGATVIHLPGQRIDVTPTKRVDLAAMLSDLAAREINELHVEAGHNLNGSLISDGLVDELLVYLAPKFIGAGLDMAHSGPWSKLTDAAQMEFRSIDPIGPDIRILARVVGHDNF